MNLAAEMEERLNEMNIGIKELGDLIEKLKDRPQILPHRSNRPRREDRMTEEFLKYHQALKTALEGLQSPFRTLTGKLVEDIKLWQNDMKMLYSEMADASVYNIDTLASWSGQLGKMVNDVIDEILPSWKGILEEIRTVPMYRKLIQEVEELMTPFRDLFQALIQCTFVVTSQGKTFYIKTGNKSFPKFTVRLMALENIQNDQQRHSVTAHFISEDDLNECCDDDALNINKIKKMERKLKSNVQKYPEELGPSCQFNDLQFLQQFKRKQDQKQVHEEKYRVVFIINIHNITYWTMSLPLVVITASNQETHCLASIMWQCYSTDVFTVPIQIPETLPWERVADMLKKKMSQISTNHNLTDDNISHLKYRLFGTDDVPDNEGVTLTTFCWTSMIGSDKERPFSFWKWFLANYNLIKKFLRSYWNDGLIHGFIKKDNAKQLLEANTLDIGTFILRFSDKYITQSDGSKNVFGHLTSCVRLLKNKGSKRKRETNEASDNPDIVECFEVGNCENLKNTKLANLLRETWVRNKERTHYKHLYCYLYPSNKTREDLFDKYCDGTDKLPVNGYSITTNAKFFCLEDNLKSISLNEITSPNLSNTETEHSGIKKHKTIKEDYPKIIEILDNFSRNMDTNQVLMPNSLEVTESFQFDLAGETIISNIPTVVHDLNPVKVDSNTVVITKTTSSLLENNALSILQTPHLSQEQLNSAPLYSGIGNNDTQIASIPTCNSNFVIGTDDEPTLMAQVSCQETDFSDLQDIEHMLSDNSQLFQDSGSNLSMGASQSDVFKGQSSCEQNPQTNISTINTPSQDGGVCLPVCYSGPIHTLMEPIQNQNNLYADQNSVIIHVTQSNVSEDQISNQPNVPSLEQTLEGLRPWLTSKQYDKVCKWILENKSNSNHK
ncbi:Signal transducer and activator of transcription 5B [Mactra antiquata]